ncbi:unannotated protein [freshwater metagenome]|uniref:Unannotated protein n=1 Tax=freshwater metagenome TaxID=449393 RepID=A0A6J7TT32_9ZZZZ
MIPLTSCCSIAVKLWCEWRGGKNHGCQPTCAGCGSAASRVNVNNTSPSTTSITWVTVPAKGQSEPRSHVIVTFAGNCSTTVHSTSSTVPCIAFGGNRNGNSYCNPRNISTPSRTRPANGTMGYKPQPRVSSAEVTNNSVPSIMRDDTRPPADVSIETEVEPADSCTIGT